MKLTKELVQKNLDSLPAHYKTADTGELFYTKTGVLYLPIM